MDDPTPDNPDGPSDDQSGRPQTGGGSDEQIDVIPDVPSAVAARGKATVYAEVVARAVDQARETHGRAARAAAHHEIAEACRLFLDAEATAAELEKTADANPPDPAAQHVLADLCPARPEPTSLHRLLARTFTRETSPDPAPDPAALDPRTANCGHQRDHPGPHHATIGAVADLGEPGEGDLWWLSWNDSDELELLSAPTCPAAQRDHTQRVTNTCSAPAGHTTPHLWWHHPRGTTL